MKALIWVAMLSSLTTGCAKLSEAQNNEPKESKVSLMICATNDGYQFQASCPPASKLTAMQAAPVQVKPEPIEPVIKPSVAPPNFTLFFGDNKYEPSVEQQRNLKKWIEQHRALLKDSPIQLQAHTSANGSESHNKILAEARALSIQTKLKEYGVKKINVNTAIKCCQQGLSESSMSLDRKVVLSIQ